MLVTREMDYAVRIVRALYRNGQMSAVSIAEQEQMQQAITYKVVKKLIKGGVVTSCRGTKGGYHLRKTGQELTFYDLFRALGEDLFLTECLEPGYLCGNNQHGGCGAHREFSRIQQVLETELRRTPLSALFDTPDI